MMSVAMMTNVNTADSVQPADDGQSGAGATILIATGGTAGHIEPALSVADALREVDPQVRIHFLGSRRGLETTIIPERGYPLHVVDASPMPRGLHRGAVSALRQIRRAARQAGEVLDTLRPAVVVGFGGYASAPAYLAARRRRVPVVIHEANARPGLANRLGARRAARVLTSSSVPWAGARHVGLPLRPAIALLDRAALRADARAELGIDPGRPLLLVFGGSQGARRINDALAGALPRILDAGVDVLHLHGAANAAIPPTTDKGWPGYHALSYLARMDLAYAAADLALCRAGAMTCGELAAVGLPAIYVPLPVGNGEQRLNALPVVAAGGGLLIPDAELTSERLADTALDLLGDRVRLDAMSAAAYSCGERDGDQAVADVVLEVIGELGKGGGSS